MGIKNLKIIGEELGRIRLEITKAVKIQIKKTDEEEVKKVQKNDESWRKVPDISENARYPLILPYNPKKLDIL